MLQISLIILLKELIAILFLMLMKLIPLFRNLTVDFVLLLKQKIQNMKKIQKLMIVVAMSTLAIVQVGCYGSFKLTSKLYDWNGGLGDKWIQSLVFWGLVIIPVYEIAAFVDFVILNLIEFWTGSNPVSMKEGEKEMQIVQKGGITYRMEATKNQFTITQLSGKNKGTVETLVYNPSDLSWTANKADKSQVVSRIEVGSNGEAVARVFNAAGKSIVIAAPSDEATLASSIQEMKAYRMTAAH